MYVYISGYVAYQFTVGFYDPTGKFIVESHYETREDASKRIHYLNGGSL